jgi:hypothetical protein
MKKTGFVLFLMTVCIALAFPSNIQNENRVQDDWEDIVDISREGGTTRIARQSFGVQSFMATVEPAVVVYSGNNEVAVTVENYTGPVFVEIYGSKGAKTSFFDVFDNGVGIISLSGLGADEYNIRITLGDITYKGTFNKGKYGHRK